MILTGRLAVNSAGVPASAAASLWVSFEGRLLPLAVGLALDDEFPRGARQPVDADWARSGSAMTASHSLVSRFDENAVAARRWRSTTRS